MAETKIYVPKQTTRRGAAGYRGQDVLVVDAANPDGVPADKALKNAQKAARKR